MNADLFHEAMLAIGFGGILNTEQFRPRQKAYFAGLKALGEKVIGDTRSLFPRLPPIYLDFAATDDLNAVATIHKGQYFIGITKGAIRTIILLFERMLADRRILADVGNAQIEESLPVLPAPLSTSLIHDNMANGPKGPRDKIRQDYCRWLTQTAFMNVFFHELGHIANGHLDMAAARGASPFIAEYWNSPPGTENEAIDSHLLEMDADGTGMNQFVGHLKLLLNNPPYAVPQLATCEGLVFSWLFSVFCFFRLFGDGSVLIADLYKAHHPPLRFRLAYAWMSILSTIPKQFDGKSPLQNPPGALQAARSAEEAFHFLSGEPIPPSTRYTETLEPKPEYRDYANRLNKRWNEGLRQELLSYAYAPPMELTIITT